MHKVILDRSIFHGDKFEQIRKSKLLEKSRKNKLRVCYTPLFIEESLPLGFLNKSDFQVQMEFLLALNSSRWFKAPSEIVSLEFGKEILKPSYYLMNQEDIQSLIDGYKNFIASEIPPSELLKVRSEIEKNDQLKNEFRTKRLEMRRDVPYNTYDLDNYFESNVDWYIENGLMRYYTNSSDYLQRWKTDGYRFRFTRQYIRAWFATVLLPVINHTLKVEKNDRADSEQLAFLHWTDIMVSDDTRFMKECFELLYSGKGKKLMKLTDFLVYIESL